MSQEEDCFRYSEMSNSDLEGIEESINKVKYPERYQLLISEINKRKEKGTYLQQGPINRNGNLFSRRLFAYIVDALILSMIAGCVQNLMFFSRPSFTFIIIDFVLFLGYFFVFESFLSDASPGKKLFKLKLYTPKDMDHSKHLMRIALVWLVTLKDTSLSVPVPSSSSLLDVCLFAFFLAISLTAGIHFFKKISPTALHDYLFSTSVSSDHTKAPTESFIFNYKKLGGIFAVFFISFSLSGHLLFSKVMTPEERELSTSLPAEIIKDFSRDNNLWLLVNITTHKSYKTGFPMEETVQINCFLPFWAYHKEAFQLIAKSVIKSLNSHVDFYKNSEIVFRSHLGLIKRSFRAPLTFNRGEI